MATILIKKRDTTGAPSAGDLTNGAGGAEIAVNTFDKRLYSKDSGGNVVEIGTVPSSLSTAALTLTGELTEAVYTLGTSGSIALDPANGAIQSSTLSGNPTFTDSLTTGQTVVLMLNGGASYTVTWPTTTWVTSAGNAAPTLTANDTLVFWKVGSTLYGAYVGSYA
jgi:hypothetical protein